MKQILALCLFVSLTSCVDFRTDEYRVLDGYLPIYGERENLKIESQEAREFEKAGKIFYYKKFIFINEDMKGIHVLNNENPANPQKVAFIQIEGNKNVAVKGNYLYANSFTDLVVVDVSSIQNAFEVQRFKNVIGRQADFTDYPHENAYYQCPAANKVVIGWKEGKLNSGSCYNYIR